MEQSPRGSGSERVLGLDRVQFNLSPTEGPHCYNYLTVNGVRFSISSPLDSYRCSQPQYLHWYPNLVYFQSTEAHS